MGFSCGNREFKEDRVLPIDSAEKRTFYPDEKEDFLSETIYSFPTEKEFKIFKELWSLLWNAPEGIEAERKCVKIIAERYSISERLVDDIDIKICYYGRYTGRILGKQPEDISWNEFYDVVKVVGIPK